MLFQIINIIAPVFIIIGAGYFAIHKQLFADNLVDSLMKYAIHFAVPCLLFRATANLDLKEAYDGYMMLAFYLAAAISFSLTGYLAYSIFKRHPGESVAIGFGALFSNSVLIGLPLSERAWGMENLDPVYAIISVHAPFCYLLGISAMEILRSDGRSWSSTSMVVIKAMFRNSLMIAIGLGFLINLSGIAMPEVLTSTIDMVSASALPVALFGLGGVLTRYKLAHSIGEITLVSIFKLLVHPALTYLFCWVLNVPMDITAAAVLIASMAPGMNSYLFASMYQRGQSIAASAVVIATPLSVISVSFWLWILS
jgi:malonate transporter and related proteins